MCGHEDVLQWVMADLVFGLVVIAGVLMLRACDTAPLGWLAFAGGAFAVALFLGASTVVAQHEFREMVALASSDGPLGMRC